MFGRSRDREAFALLQEEVRKLSDQLAKAESDIGTVTMRHARTVATLEALEEALGDLKSDIEELRALLVTQQATESERRAAIEADVQQLLADRRGMALLIAANAEQLEAQADVVAADAVRLEDQIKQCRASQTRLERQTEADLIELRETDAALASSLLRLRTTAGPINDIANSEAPETRRYGA